MLGGDWELQAGKTHGTDGNPEGWVDLRGVGGTRDSSARSDHHFHLLRRLPNLQESMDRPSPHPLLVRNISQMLGAIHAAAEAF